MLPLVVALVFAVLLCTCVSCAEEAPACRNVTAEEAYKMITAGEVVILDFRVDKRFERGHIPGAVNLPLSELSSKMDELAPTDDILVYHSCSSCSEKAARDLVENGFRHVYHLQGGFTAWEESDLPVT